MINVYQYKVYDMKFDCYQISEEYATDDYIESLENAVALVETAKEVEDNDVDNGRCISIKIDIKSSINILTQNLKERENNLTEGLLAEYIKRKKFICEALNNYFDNVEKSTKLCKDVSEDDLKRSKIRNRFLIASVIVIILALTPIESKTALVIAYLFSIAYYGTEYLNIINNRVTQLGSIALNELEVQRISRELAMYGVDFGYLIRYQSCKDVLRVDAVVEKVNEVDILKLEHQQLLIDKCVMQNLKQIE